MLHLSKLQLSYQPVNDPYGTHLNLLRAVGHGIKKVLELGAGIHSTAVFLDRNYYPDLESLVSVEQNPDWIVSPDDPRHTSHIVPEPIEEFIDTLDINTFDLILVDNSTFAERRCETLRYVANRVGRSIVVAHDYERQDYAAAASEFTYAVVDDRQVPHTALLWRSR
jgi:hypothetical protein